MLKPCVALFALVALLSLANAQPALTPRVSQQKNALAVAFFEQNQRVDLTAGSGVELRLPDGEFAALSFNQQTRRGKVVELIRRRSLGKRPTAGSFWRHVLMNGRRGLLCPRSNEG